MLEKMVKLDVEKVKRLIAMDGRKQTQICISMGLGSTFLSNILADRPEKGHRAGEMKKCYLKALCDELNVTEEAILFKEEKVKEEKVLCTESLEEKMDDLIMAINKLGNIQMQIMEYIKVIMSDTSTATSNLKQLNDKWNKPSAYKPTYRKGN